MGELYHAPRFYTAWTQSGHSLYLLRRLENADILPLNSNKGWPRPDSFTLKERLNIFAKPIWKHLGPMNSAVDVAPICRLALSICPTVFTSRWKLSTTRVSSMDQDWQSRLPTCNPLIICRTTLQDLSTCRSSRIFGFSLKKAWSTTICR